MRDDVNPEAGIPKTEFVIHDKFVAVCMKTGPKNDHLRQLHDRN